jgi:arsenate reductase-like glutaredoxin family protein
MSIKKQFEYNPNIDLTAAQIGISKWNWISINKENDSEALEVMKHNKFDVLPVVNSNGQIEKFYSTREWNNYSHLNLNKIESSLSVYYRLSIEDLIRKFAVNGTHYYFLTNDKDVLGLVSMVNLNSQPVYNYLYFILSDIERSIATMLSEYLDLQDILDTFSNSEDTHLQEILKNYYEAVEKGLDNTIFEHMFLQTVGITVNKLISKIPEQYKALNKFSSKFSANGLYNEIRKRVMHPVRPILSNGITVTDLNQLLSDYAAIKQILEN